MEFGWSIFSMYFFVRCWLTTYEESMGTDRLEPMIMRIWQRCYVVTCRDVGDSRGRFVVAVLGMRWSNENIGAGRLRLILGLVRGW